MGKIDKLLEVLEKIYQIIQLIYTKNYGALSLPEDELLTRQEVMDYLGISESTYKRKVKNRQLHPHKFPGGDRFYRSELMDELKESKRRGRK
ncbi:helix-turn-helix domain-containing protein [Pedobacter sp. MC2016-05]|uniref:helix-turn-helix transcriptional regulator n=1 Tax=Pedobacter sp. MC2016-05 TaxID=2994474 RepID=UPI0022478A8E|nr:helix-turn-helix domain-containing protein [Pedobacter sp. MC2016-05]MCX2477202.1 helix-turn-helix domain-containing protein [Pedobacter sp. MC2016-05]